MKTLIESFTLNKSRQEANLGIRDKAVRAKVAFYKEDVQFIVETEWLWEAVQD